MGDVKSPKVRLQWQDGVGNMQIFGDEEGQDKEGIRLAEVDVGWAMAVAGLVVFLIFSLCMMARCRLSMFTRRRKKKLGRSLKEKKAASEKAASEKAAKASDKKEVKKVMAISATSKQHDAEIKDIEKKKKTKKDFILDMIDSVLDPASDTEHINCSLESIDRAGEEHWLRRASDVSLALSLVFDRESDRPVFVKHKQGGSGRGNV
eukprot:GFUD01056428.1.p1 GENE.GFUD01056428.1~~GFUD01056428.1.p1  ORF type:complete len:206 (-),score=84.28 GFUD01056428.1:840-1457(-)